MVYRSLLGLLHGKTIKLGYIRITGTPMASQLELQVGEVIQVADEQLRFPLGELLRRFKRDDGATCASIESFSWFHPSWRHGLRRRQHLLSPPERCHHFGEFEGTTWGASAHSWSGLECLENPWAGELRQMISIPTLPVYLGWRWSCLKMQDDWRCKKT